MGLQTFRYMVQCMRGFFQTHTVCLYEETKRIPQPLLKLMVILLMKKRGGSKFILKILPAMQGTCVQSLGWEDPLEMVKATHSSIQAWRIRWTV